MEYIGIKGLELDKDTCKWVNLILGFSWLMWESSLDPHDDLDEGSHQ